MIHSMTAFARHTGDLPGVVLVWEMRSVNHRYLEPAFRLPDAQRALEGELREQLRHRLARGKVECILKLQRSRSEQAGISVDRALAREVIETARALSHDIGAGAAPIDPLAVLQWPGVMAEAADDSDAQQQAVLAGFSHCLDQLLEQRAREGRELAEFITRRLRSVAEIVAAVRRQLPAILGAQREKLAQRLEHLKAELDPARLEQEIALLAAKADVDEELDRLQTHVQEVQRVLDTGGPCGRRLDFLMQELNREANTLSSKSLVSDTTQAAVELKVLIEQMREQIQNIE